MMPGKHMMDGDPAAALADTERDGGQVAIEHARQLLERDLISQDEFAAIEAAAQSGEMLADEELPEWQRAVNHARYLQDCGLVSQGDVDRIEAQAKRGEGMSSREKLDKAVVSAVDDTVARMGERARG